MKVSFKRNMGMTDRVIRTCLGMFLIVAGLVFLTETSGVLLILSIPLLISGLTGFCPTYILLGISTRPRSEESGR